MGKLSLESTAGAPRASVAASPVEMLDPPWSHLPTGRGPERPESYHNSSATNKQVTLHGFLSF